MLATAAAAHAQERSALAIEIAGAGGQKQSYQLYTASHALVIGIDKYTEKGWPPLRAMHWRPVKPPIFCR